MNTVQMTRMFGIGFLVLFLQWTAVAAAPSYVIEFERSSNFRALTDSNMTKASRGELVRHSLIQYSSEQQADVVDFLTSANIPHRSFWISNSIILQDSSLLQDWIVLRQLKAFPGVVSVREATTIFLDAEYLKTKDVDAFTDPTLQRNATLCNRPNCCLESSSPIWNVKLVEAPAAWAAGFDGAGVTVANIDTGARYDHIALSEAYRAKREGNENNHDYNWLDPTADAFEFPRDVQGHGSHTMGSIVGSARFGFGVSPGSSWIACKAFVGGSAREEDILTCGQFLLCPFRQNGLSPDCARAPDIISISWGEPGVGGEYLRSVFEAWEAAGIFTVAAIGNSGSRCSSTFGPANFLNTFGVGSVGSSGAVSAFSSRGPGPSSPGYGNVKPDLVAPGDNIPGVAAIADNTCGTMSGTSMATPHAAGVAALVLSARPGLSVRELWTALTASAQRAARTGDGCGTPLSAFPNNFYGNGIADACAAVRFVGERC
jgi:hypothetical protein